MQKARGRAALVEFTSADEFETWLEDKPREWAVVLAARVALRALPLIVDEQSVRQPEFASTIALPAFRATAASWTAAVYPGESATVSMGGVTIGVGSTAAEAAYRTAFDASLAAALISFGAKDAIGATARAVSSAMTQTERIVADPASAKAHWQEISSDAADLENGIAAEKVGRQPLWRLGMISEWAAESWKTLTNLLRLEDDWDVWIKWYRQILAGRNSHVNTDAARQIDLAYLMFNNADWDEGPAHVNALIKRRIADIEARYRGEGQNAETSIDLGLITDPVAGNVEAVEIPPQLPAPIEAAIVDDRVVRVQPAASNAGPDVAAIHTILRAEAAWLRDRLSGQMPDAGAALQALMDELRAGVSDANIYGVGYWANVLSQISSRVDERLIEDAAGRFAGLVVNLDRFLKQFPEWNAYVRKAENAELEALAGTDTEGETLAIASAISDETELIDEGVAGPLAALNRALLDAQMYNPETAYGFYRSLANVLQALAEIALRDGPDALRSLAKEFGAELRKKSISSAAGGVLLLVGYQLAALAGLVPSMFGFLQPILRLLGISP